MRFFFFVTFFFFFFFCQGVITPGEAQALGGLVEAHRKALELGEIERRIAALENKGSKK